VLRYRAACDVVINMFFFVCVQLYVIMAALSDQAVPCAYALLQHKRQDTYVQLLQALEKHCMGLGVQPDPRVVVTDFESAAMQAVKQVFGCDVDTHGCFFHLTQATWRRIQSEGHAELYKTDDEFRVFCGMMDGLGFLPVNDVKKGQYTLRKAVVTVCLFTRVKCNTNSS